MNNCYFIIIVPYYAQWVAAQWQYMTHNHRNTKQTIKSKSKPVTSIHDIQKEPLLVSGRTISISYFGCHISAYLIVWKE